MLWRNVVYPVFTMMQYYSVNPASTSMDNNHYLLHERFLNQYALCGQDHAGRSIMWIRAPKWTAWGSHGNRGSTCRNYVPYRNPRRSDIIAGHGITFIIDTSNKSAKQRRPTNDKKLQKTWQAMPLRPQTILIAGASYPLRIIINTLITITSIFSKKKC